ncbi:hypothetical protein GGI1_22801, partial [Acidithiobacillus sp. GGI-221]
RFAKNPHTGKNFKEFGLRETPIGRTGRDGVKPSPHRMDVVRRSPSHYPEWNKRKHVWTLLGKVSRKMKAALAA